MTRLVPPVGNVSGLRFFLALTFAGAALVLPGRLPAETVAQIRDPRPASRVVDLAQVLDGQSRAAIEAAAADVRRAGDGELMVAVVRRIDGGEDPRRFATTLFNRWGIGDAGSDRGVLLFLSVEDRAAEIVLGNGLDSTLSVNKSDAIMERAMVPRFRQGDLAGGMVAGAQEAAAKLFGAPSLAPPVPRQLEAPSSAPKVQPLAAPATKSPETRPARPARPASSASLGLGDAVLGLGCAVVVLGLLGLGIWGLVRLFRPPHCERCRVQRVLLGEAEDDAYLTPEQQTEERIGSRNHQVWLCPTCGSKLLRDRMGRRFDLFRCGACGARALRRSRTTVRHATELLEGEAVVHDHCEHCGFDHQERVAIARLTPPQPSSSYHPDNALPRRSFFSSFRSSSGSSSPSGSSSGGSSSGRGSSWSGSSSSSSSGGSSSGSGSSGSSSSGGSSSGRGSSGRW